MDVSSLNMMQRRAMAREAIGKLHAVTELFYDDGDAWLKWKHGVEDFEKWVWDESPIA